MKKSLFLLSCFAILCGCAKEHAAVPEEGLVPPQTRSRYLSLDSIQQLAVELPGMFSDDPSTRSGKKGVVADLVPLSDFMQSGVTKSGATDAAVTKNIYVINYADDQGYAILAADTLMETVLAYSDKGNLTENFDNPGVRMFMEMIPGYADQQLARINPDSLSDDEKYPPREEFIVRRDYSQVGPFVPVRWHQGYPFNDALPFKNNPLLKCPNGRNGNPPAGCVAIAMLNIMIANSWPASFDGQDDQWYGCDWAKWRGLKDHNDVIRQPNDMPVIAKLVRTIGKSASMKYGCDGSSANMKEADYAFRCWFGFTTDGIYSFHIDRVMADLYANHPIMIRGDATSHWIGYSDGHAWVIDGYKNVYRVYAIYDNFYDENHNLTRKEYVGERSEMETRWLHCNYGWGGDGNGYYYVGVFNTGSPVESDPECGKDKDPLYYRFRLEVLKNIRPIR